MSDILERPRAQVVRRSTFNPMSHVVEIEADQFYEMINEIDDLTRLKEGQAQVNSELRKENKRLKDIDTVMRSFDFGQLKKEQDDLAREGFEQVLKSRRGYDTATRSKKTV